MAYCSCIWHCWTLGNACRSARPLKVVWQYFRIYSISRLHLKHNKQRFCLRSYNMSAQNPAFDWNKIVHKNVRSNDMRYLGNVTDVDNDSFILLQDADQRYRIPKSRVKDFDGNDLTVDFRFNDLLLIELASLRKTINTW